MVTANEDGSVAYIVFEASGSWGPSAVPWQGILIATASLRSFHLDMKVVADSNTLMPGTSSYFNCVGSQAVSMTGVVAFFGSNCTTESKKGKRLAHSDSLVHSNDLYPFVFPGIFKWSHHTGIMTVASAATKVPGSVKDQFQGFSDPAIGSDGTIAFIALTNGGRGVFASSPRDVLTTVAATSQSVPGAVGQVFKGFPFLPSVGTDGVVLFFAYASGGYSGVYSGVLPMSDSTSWSVLPELTLQDQVMNQSIVYIGFGTNAYSTKANVFATYLVLKNDLDGIWTFSRKQPHNIGSIIV